MTALTPAQARALDHARALLAEDNAEDTLGDPDWHRMCRLALRDILAAFDAARTDSEVLAVTVTCADDPRDYMHEGDPVQFAGFTVGVMPPEATDTGRIRGGKLFWQASGVRSRVAAAKS